MATLTLAALYVTGAGCAAGKDDDPAATATAGIGSQTQTSTGVGGQGGQGGDGGQGGLGGDGGEGGEGGECFTAQQCADGNPCTLDGCFNGRCGYNDVDPDDDIACTVDSCDPVDFVIHEPIDSDCALGEICAVDTGCEPIGDGDQNGVVIISELDFDAARIEIHNATSSDVDVRGYVLENPTQTADIRAVDDLDASQGTAVVLGPGAFLVGMANPSDGVVPPDVDFVYGDPGGGFAVSAAGDVLGLYSEAGDLEDIVDFGQIHSDPDSDVPLDAFVVMAGVTSQLDDASLTAIANDDGSSWCLSFFPHEPVAGVRSRISDTLGEANGSCRAFVINELLYDYDSPGSGADEGQVFVEIAGPGGGLLTGVRLVGIEGSDGSEQSPDVTFGPARMPLDGLWVVADGDVDGGATLVPEADVVLAAGDPENGADAIRLESASAAVLDELAYGAVIAGVGEGNPTLDEAPTRMAIALARDLLHSDSDDNASDFHLDPTPTPGLPNEPLTPTLFSITPDDGPAAAGETVTVETFDFAELGSGAPLATFAGVAGSNCVVVAVVDAGRGNAFYECTASVTAAAVRGDFQLQNPAVIGGQDVLIDAWTFTTPQNETNAASEVDFCNVQFPSSETVTSGTDTQLIYGRIYEAGLTEAAGAPAGVTAELGFGPINDPRFDAGWQFFAAPYNVQIGNDDEFFRTLTAPTVTATTNYRYAYRFSFDDGLTFTYCDVNGAGSDPGLSFNPAGTGLLTVNP